MDAIKFYSEHFTGDQLQEVFEGMYKLLSDVASSIDEIAVEDPRGEVSKKKQ